VAGETGFSAISMVGLLPAFWNRMERRLMVEPSPVAGYEFAVVWFAFVFYPNSLFFTWLQARKNTLKQLEHGGFGLFWIF
jgi:hypothetical protein